MRVSLTTSSTTTTQSLQEKKVAREKPICFHQWLLAVAVSLICLLLAACTALGILYDRELKACNVNLDRILSEHQYVSNEYQKVLTHSIRLQEKNISLTQQNIWLHLQTEKLNLNKTWLTNLNTDLHQAIWNLTNIYYYLLNKTSYLMQLNTQIETENINFSYTVAELQQWNKDLTDTNAHLEGKNQNLSDINDLLRTELKGTTKKNAQLLTENKALLVQNCLLQEQSQNMTQQNAWLEEKNQEMLNASMSLKGQYTIMAENNKWLSEANQVLLEQNRRLNCVKYNLTQENARLKETRLNLANDNDKLRADKENLSNQNQVFSQSYSAVQHYCPVINENTQERICKKCPQSWIFFQSKCYFFSNESRSWQDSESHCQSAGAELLIVNSGDEQMFVSVRSQNVYHEGKRFWIGMSDLKKEGEWHWVDGTAVTDTFQYWLPRTGAPGEPDDWKEVNPSGEDCGHISTFTREQNFWMDGSCDMQYHWICERVV